MTTKESTNSKQLWKRVKKDDSLYEKYAQHLEKGHKGEFVAISNQGKTIVGTDDITVLKKAIKQFGSGNFAFRKIGSPTLGKWRQSFGFNNQ